MGHCCLRSLGRTSSFEEDHGLLLCDPAGDLDEPLGLLETFQVNENGFRLSILGEVFEDFTFFDVHFVSQSDDPGHPEVFPRRDVTHRMSGEVSGLGDIGDGTLRDFPEGEEAGGESMRGRGMAGGVGTQDPDTGLPDDADQIVLKLLPLLIHFGKASRGQDNGPNSPGGTISHCLRVQLGGENDDGQVDSFRKIGNGGKGLHSQNFLPFRIHQVKTAGIPIGQDISNHLVAGLLGRCGCADDDDAPGFKEFFEVNRHRNSFRNSLRFGLDKKFGSRPLNLWPKCQDNLA